MVTLFFGCFPGVFPSFYLLTMPFLSALKSMPINTLFSVLCSLFSILYTLLLLSTLHFLSLAFTASLPSNLVPKLIVRHPAFAMPCLPSLAINPRELAKFAVL